MRGEIAGSSGWLAEWAAAADVPASWERCRRCCARELTEGAMSLTATAHSEMSPELMRGARLPAAGSAGLLASVPVAREGRCVEVAEASLLGEDPRGPESIEVVFVVSRKAPCLRV